MTKANDWIEAKPLDLTAELNSLKKRIEALEQKVYTINDRRLGPQTRPDLDTEALEQILDKVRRTL